MENKKVLIAFILILVLGGTFAVLALKTQKPVNKEIKEKPEAINVQTEVNVSVQKIGFMPAVIKVRKGQTVTWTNNDTKLHRVSSDPHPLHNGLFGFDSVEPLGKNETYSFIFEKTGKFTYHDHLNPLKFKGMVIVE